MTEGDQASGALPIAPNDLGAYRSRSPGIIIALSASTFPGFVPALFALLRSISIRSIRFRKT